MRADLIPGAASSSLLLPLLLVSLLLLPGESRPSDVTVSANYSTPLGIALEGYPYPYPVAYLCLTMEEQPVRMAYMLALPTRASSGRIVLLLHDEKFFGAYWDNTIKALTDAGHLVVVPDQIGFGKSSKPDVHYSLDVFADNTIRLLEHLKLKTVVAVGHSMGAMLAVHCARSYPSYFSHLVLINPIGLDDRSKLPPRNVERLFERELGRTDPQQIRSAYRQYVVDWKPLYEQFVEVRTRVALSAEYPRWAKAAALIENMICEQSVRHECCLIRQPTFIVVGQENRLAAGLDQTAGTHKTAGPYPQLARAVAKEIPECKLIELAKVGNIPHLEAPELFHKALLDFLKL